MLRTIDWQGKKIVNVCDKDLLGKTVKEGKIEMNISSNYFDGELVSLDTAIQIIKSSNMINLAGNKIIFEVINAKLACEDAIKKVGGIPFLMIFKFFR